MKLLDPVEVFAVNGSCWSCSINLWWKLVKQEKMLEDKPY